MLMMTVPMTSMAAIGPGFEEGTYIATITADSVNINKAKDSEEVLTTAKAGDTYEVLEDLGNGWMKIRVNDTEGYLPVSENAEVEEAEVGEIEEIQRKAIESSGNYKREQLAFRPVSSGSGKPWLPWKRPGRKGKRFTRPTGPSAIWPRLPGATTPGS